MQTLARYFLIASMLLVPINLWATEAGKKQPVSPGTRQFISSPTREKIKPKIEREGESPDPADFDNPQVLTKNKPQVLSETAAPETANAKENKVEQTTERIEVNPNYGKPGNFPGDEPIILK